MIADVQETYFTDMQEKNRLAQSGRMAAYKTHKCASSQKPPQTPTYSMNMKKPMSWQEFKALPITMQRSYIENLLQVYNPSVTAMAKMLGVNKYTLYKYLSREGIDTGGRRGNTAKSDLRFFAEFCISEEESSAKVFEEKAEVADNNIEAVNAEDSAETDSNDVVETVEDAKPAEEQVLNIDFFASMTEEAIGSFVKALISNKSNARLIWIS